MHIWTIVVWILGAIEAQGQQQSDYPNLLNLQGTPKSLTDQSIWGFSDLGAWHVVSLPSQVANAGSFTGPYLEGVGFIGSAFLQFQIANDDPVSANFQSYPGMLYQNYTSSTGLVVQLWLVGASTRSSLLRILVSNPTPKLLQPQFRWIGSGTYIPTLILNTYNGTDGMGVIGSRIGSGGRFIDVHLAPSLGLTNSINGSSYIFNYQSTTLGAGDSWQTYASLSATFNETEQQNEQKAMGIILSDFAQCGKVVQTSQTRWNTYLAKTVPSQATATEARAAVKALEILMTNWRSAGGPYLRDGIFPSYYGYQGFWAWDSWKHAMAIAGIVSDLAKSQVRVMLDLVPPTGAGYEGMVADVIQSDGSVNWRNSKPPLAAWAVDRIYQETSDLEFLTEIYPRLVSYHKWWYSYRDVNQNGLCEYGATDGTTTAAKWESGMDNAVRFDNSTMVKTSDHAWSFNQESVDLNSYLYAEKLYLAKFATALGNSGDATTFTTQAATLKTQIQQTFWNNDTGYFHDRQLNNGPFISALGCEGWLPLWAGAATTDQAASVRAVILDEKKFNTFVPFPTVSADNPQFDAAGYWRGPMWFDQAYFGIRGLSNTGYQTDSTQLQNKLLTNVQGLSISSQLSLYEQYNPLNGNTEGTSFFGWSSAHVIMLVNNF